LLAHHGNASYENKEVTIKGKATLVNFGFDATTFKSGDEVTVVMSAVAKTGAPIGRINRIILANGYVMNSEVR